MLTREDIQAYWRNPDAENLPETYLTHKLSSSLVADIIKGAVPKTAKILEIGCNAGANLRYLSQRGFKNLEGVEINAEAVALLRRTRPSLKTKTIYVSPIEEFAPIMGDYDFIFTLAVFEHLHPDSEWVFGKVASHCRFLLTVEDERSGPNESWRHFPRDYGKVFTELGMTEVSVRTGLSDVGLDDNFIARLFTK